VGLILYLITGLLGLVAGAYACLGVIILIAPETGSEASLWFIFPSAIAGAVLLPLLIRKFRKRAAA
jgi:ABC-type cobalamin transport system permease subunit